MKDCRRSAEKGLRDGAKGVAQHNRWHELLLISQAVTGGTRMVFSSAWFAYKLLTNEPI